MSRNLRVAAVVLATFLITGCSSRDSGARLADPSDSVAKTGVFNDDDVMFAQMMIPHHEQAIELADIALDPTVNAGDEVKNLATRIRNAQDPEIMVMKNLLSTWGKSTEMDPSVDHADMMSGMLSIDDIERLTTLRGTEFDRAWMLAMIAHHEGAIKMANDAIADGNNDEVQSLARSIVAAQQAEIAEMQSLLN